MSSRPKGQFCIYCGGYNARYIGITDGGGFYGTATCDEWECLDCGHVWEDGCVEVAPLPDYDEDPDYHELPPWNEDE